MNPDVERRAGPSRGFRHSISAPTLLQQEQSSGMADLALSCPRGPYRCTGQQVSLRGGGLWVKRKTKLSIYERDLEYGTGDCSAAVTGKDVGELRQIEENLRWSLPSTGQQTTLSGSAAQLQPESTVVQASKSSWGSNLYNNSNVGHHRRQHDRGCHGEEDRTA